MGKSGTVTVKTHTPGWQLTNGKIIINAEVRSPSLTLGSPIQDTAPERQTPQTSGIEVQWGLHAAEPKGYRKERCQS